MILPLPDSLIPMIKNKVLEPFSQTVFKEILKKIGSDLFIPFVTLEKLRSGLHRLLARDFSDRATADFICGTSLHHSTPLYYVSFEAETVLQAYERYVQSILKHINDDTKRSYLEHIKQEIRLSKNNYVGSQKVPQREIVSAVFKEIAQRVTAAHAKNSTLSIYEKFNHYSLWLWHVFLLLTGQRPVASAPGRLADMNTELGIIWISDKERYEKTAGRIVPLCPFLLDAIENYKRYLNAIKIKLSRESDNVWLISKILSGHKPLIYFFEEHRLKPARPKLVQARMKRLLPMDLNWTRHVARSMIQSNWSESIMDMSPVDAVFGHEAPDQEAWHPYSALSGNDLYMLHMNFEIIAIELDLIQVEVYNQL